MGRVLVVLALFGGLTLFGESRDGFPSCPTELQDGSLAGWLTANAPGSARAFDRKGQPIGGQSKIVAGRLWLYPDWAEPLLLAEGNPLQPVEGVRFAAGRFTLLNAEISGP